MAEDNKGIQESLDHIIKHMATKDDVREIVENLIEEKQVATKEDIKGIVSSAHVRIDNEGIERKKLEVRVVKLETSVLG